MFELFKFVKQCFINLPIDGTNQAIYFKMFERVSVKLG